MNVLWFLLYAIIWATASLPELPNEEQWIRPHHYLCTNDAFLINDYVCPFRMCFTSFEKELVPRSALTTPALSFYNDGCNSHKHTFHIHEYGATVIVSEWAMPADDVRPIREWSIFYESSHLFLLITLINVANNLTVRWFHVPLFSTFFVFFFIFMRLWRVAVVI